MMIISMYFLLLILMERKEYRCSLLTHLFQIFIIIYAQVDCHNLIDLLLCLWRYTDMEGSRDGYRGRYRDRHTNGSINRNNYEDRSTRGNYR
jgi:hypothetical protein